MKAALAALVKECESYKKDWFTSGWDEFELALKQAKAVLEDKNATPEKRNEAEAALKKAKEGLVKREKYTAEDPFVFPWRKNPVLHWRQNLQNYIIRVQQTKNGH